MTPDEWIVFLSGAVAVAYALAGIYFLRFWRRTGDPLFRSFAAAFGLLMANQVIVAVLGDADERSGYAYILRVVGFLLILIAIVRKNLRRA